MASMVKLAGCMMEPSLSPVPVTLHRRAIVGPRCTRVRAACGDDGEDGIAMEPAGSGGTASAPPSMACRHPISGPPAIDFEYFHFAVTSRVSCCLVVPTVSPAHHAVVYS